MKVKNIAFVIYSLGSGGAERAVSGLANHLVKEHNVTIVSLVKKDPFYPLDPKIELLYCSNTIKTKTNPIQSMFDGFGRIINLYKILRKGHIQIVISFMTNSNIYSIWAAKLAGIPSIISERANHAIDTIPRFQSFVRNVSYKFSNYLVVQTEENKKFYTRHMLTEKVKVIPNAIAESLRTKKESPNPVSKSQNVILNVGSFKNGKAQDLLIRAFAQIPKDDDWYLTFVGDGMNKEKFMKLADKLNVSDRIEFAGNKGNIHDYYNQSDIFAFTSEHEGFPNALMEALYFGLPAISTDCNYGPSELIKHGHNGFLIEVGNQEQLQDRLQELMNNKMLREKMSKRASASTKRFEMELIADKWLHYMEQLV